MTVFLREILRGPAERAKSSSREITERLQKRGFKKSRRINDRRDAIVEKLSDSKLIRVLQILIAKPARNGENYENN